MGPLRCTCKQGKQSETAPMTASETPPNAGEERDLVSYGLVWDPSNEAGEKSPGVYVSLSVGDKRNIGQLHLFSNHGNGGAAWTW